LIHVNTHAKGKNHLLDKGMVFFPQSWIMQNKANLWNKTNNKQNGHCNLELVRTVKLPKILKTHHY